MQHHNECLVREMAVITNKLVVSLDIRHDSLVDELRVRLGKGLTERCTTDIDEQRLVKDVEHVLLLFLEKFHIFRIRRDVIRVEDAFGPFGTRLDVQGSVVVLPLLEVLKGCVGCRVAFST